LEDGGYSAYAQASSVSLVINVGSPREGEILSSPRFAILPRS
jgi:hypothetical protein